jgi:hypothetical protein
LVQLTPAFQKNKKNQFEFPRRLGWCKMTLQSQETKFEKKTNQNKFHCVAADVDLGRLPPFLLGENSKEKTNLRKKLIKTKSILMEFGC